MAGGRSEIELSMDELREVAGYALACAEPVLVIFERDCPGDLRVRGVLEEVRRFVVGGKRGKAIRVAALDAHRAARAAEGVGCGAAGEAARAAGHVGGAAYLHPLAKATQGGHILMSAACAARALELDAGGDFGVGSEYIGRAAGLASPVVVDVLMRYPEAPGGRGRVGELWRELDGLLRRMAAGR
ncbi:exonuclease SbcC [Nocardia terpenica]|uniref:Exonuclease SbcC n=3 Tax=Nocardia terpenica TaxID=455432 RepID=A0A291RYC0_9NOCA|nr:exonuclease SbcC [Nocardia terpenica]ATL72310.1 exonuclease SbcC [Nocardia terpenica]